MQLVQVDLVATDSKGNVVTDLTAADFVVKENGKVQTLEHFYNSADDENRFPLTMSFLVDTSSSMQELVGGMTRIDIAVDAAEMVVDQLKIDDEIELIEFNEKPQAVVPFTSESDVILDGLDRLKFQEAGTAMHDSFVYALDRIKERSGRKIIVIFSDGMDTSSKSIYEDVIDSIRKSDATIIAFFSEIASLDWLGPQGNPNSVNRVRVRAGEDALRDYAEKSGGQFFSFRKEPELVKAMDTLRAIIKSQYTLSYKPDASAKKGFRKIKVECKRKGVKLRHREGYTAG